ncbi:hypothetical protein [Rhizobium sp. RM]|uniref:hypothetical protein n=1 Tax=Rhizobium sp. RM TaxID=2748079 RepID=UPI00110DD3C9|nr:hypothetical protein [Rhizobium sp. RM]NWJ26457.1 hypothetical protein [Rhizobium sp. RM]TMV18074.1 hypothetical protein BJG94_15910 [Rhizobium sp. Td3]
MRNDGQHFYDRFPGVLALSFGAVAWGICSSATASLGLYLQNRLETDNFLTIAVLFFVGGLLGWLVAAAAFCVVPSASPNAIRFGTAFILVAISTCLATALIFALQYRVFYAQWHAPVFSRIWFFQQLFTSLGAIYQFSVIGLRLYFPYALLPILLASAILCRRTH